MTLPSLFVSHGAPSLALYDSPARRFLQTLGAQLPEQPKAILVVSAHWETRIPAVTRVARNTTIHDFGGFEPELYAMRYPAPGSPPLADRVSDLLAAAGLPCEQDLARGLDHGAWVPLMLAFPHADIPVVQLSLQSSLGPAHHLALGKALAPLRAEGVLVIGSGSFTHDLSTWRQYRDAIAAPEPDWVADFATWLDTALSQGRTADLLGYRRLAPHAARNHQSEEHLLPLFVALGAGGEGGTPRHLHASTTHGVLRMDVYAFGDAA